MGGLARDMGAIGESSHLLGSGLQLRGRLSYELGFRVINGLKFEFRATVAFSVSHICQQTGARRC